MLTQIPYASKFPFKEKFIERYSKLTDWEEFKKYTTSYLRRSFRVNTLKSSIKEIKSRLKKDWQLSQVPWCKQGFFITGDRRDIGNLPEHLLGYIYVQEATSMIPPLALNPKKHETILDMAAAPGSKATQIAAMMENTGILVTNDINYDRITPLSINMQRCGVTNAIITMMNGKNINYEFDRILLDSPCSGTGVIRKSLKTILTWNPGMIKKISGFQKQLILSAYKNLKDKGTLVYSTCSLEPEENEEVIDFLLDKEPCKLEKINLKIKSSPAILKFENKEYNTEIEKCLRIWPQDNNTEGFFVAKIKKF